MPLTPVIQNTVLGGLMTTPQTVTDLIQAVYQILTVGEKRQFNDLDGNGYEKIIYSIEYEIENGTIDIEEIVELIRKKISA